ncbi:unnamed protein product, partial [marine sediment metagenome]
MPKDIIFQKLLNLLDDVVGNSVCFIVLDEIDILIKKKGGNEILYDLTRLNEKYQLKKCRVCLIGISNILKFKSFLDPRVLSSFGGEELVFPAYLTNAGMVLIGGGKPVDGGKNFIDGRRIFGPGKTWKGLIRGPLLIGIPISAAISLLFIFLWGVIEPIPSEGIINGVYKYYNSMIYFRYYFIGGRPDDNLIFGYLTIIIRIFLCA